MPAIGWYKLRLLLEAQIKQALSEDAGKRRLNCHGSTKSDAGPEKSGLERKFAKDDLGRQHGKIRGDLA